MWYSFDIIKYVKQVLPPILRKTVLFEIAKILVSPLIYIYTMLSAYRISCNDKLGINGQVIYIEKILNDKNFLINNEIYITDITEKYNYIYPKGGEPLYINTKDEGVNRYFKNKGEGKYSGDFSVNVPSFLADKVSDIRSLTNYYKPAGRGFIINIYNYE